LQVHIPNTIKYKKNNLKNKQMKSNNIKTEKEYRDICAAMDVLIEKGTKLGDMELLTNEDKSDYMRLSAIVR